MKRHLTIFTLALAANFFINSALAQSTSPLSPEELEAIYSATITKRSAAVLEQLGLSNPARSNIVQAHVISHYRALRARDEAVDTMLATVSKDIPGAQTNRIAIIRILTKPLHDQFIAKLSADLTPQQIEQVKDKMTYDKVKVTFTAYCQILPSLDETEKAKILDALKQAREEAIDGGTADEKSAIFQIHKDKINEYLNAHGYDVAKATKDWEAKQPKDSTAKTEPAK
jgi:hypothetical protein